MALEPGHRTTSPTSSGRSSPVPKVLRKGAEDALYKKDKNFRRYAQAIERALSFFETPSQDWADYISFLGRLLKSLQAHPGEVHAIPHSNTVATRLAQCMNPALPSGVHQKAIEVYGYIFSVLGRDPLSRDLNLYLPGLSSLPSFASLTVRPLFISLIETYILKLNPEALRPALKSLILCLLPGLEEETSEDFERVLQALDRLGYVLKSHAHQSEEVESTRDSLFWQCLFLAVITNPSRRQGALAYLVRFLPRFAAPKAAKGGSSGSEYFAISGDATLAITPEPGLLVRCFSAGLGDEQILIQRGFLDLLVTRLPLDSPVLQSKVNQADLERLVAAAAGVVARRDMSLNRRLWSWFLGPEPTAGGDENSSEVPDGGDETSHSAIYLSKYGLKPLTRSLLAMIRQETTLPTTRARPFRICLSLMDRWEVGGLVVPEIFIPALQSIERYSQSASKEELDEVLRSASNFFDGVESGLIWGKLLELMSFALRPSSLAGDESTAKLRLARFILTSFNVREEEMLLDHMPLVMVSVLHLLTQYVAQGRESRFYNADVTSKALEFTEWLVQNIPERALQSKDTSQTRRPPFSKSSEAYKSISDFYFKAQGNLDVQDTPLSTVDVAYHSVSLAGALFTSSLQEGYSSNMIEVTSRILSTLLQKSRNFNGLDEIDLLSALRNALETAISSPLDSAVPYHSVVAITTVLVPLQTARVLSPFIDSADLPSLIHPLVRLVWQYLTPWRPKYHVESARCLWQLHILSQSSRLVEASLTSLMLTGADDSLTGESAEAGRRFAVLWTHLLHERGSQATDKGSRPVSRSNSHVGTDLLNANSSGIQAVLTRPLFRVLDALEETGTELHIFVIGWLQELQSLNRLFDILATHLRALHSLQKKTESLQSAPKPTSNVNRGSGVVADAKECLYIIKIIANILKHASSQTWSTMVEDWVPPLDNSSAAVEPVTLQVFVTQVSMRALAIALPRSGGSDRAVIGGVHRTAADILLRVLQGPHAAPLKDFELEIPLMSLVRISPPVLQTMLLETIVAALQLRLADRDENPKDHGRKLSRDIVNGIKRLSMSQDRGDTEQAAIPPPPQLIECLKAGFTSSSSRLVLDEWVKFLANVLPMFEDTMFQNLLPLVEVFCGEIEELFSQLRSTFKNPPNSSEVPPESTIISLMNGLEQILEKAHSRLVQQESKPITAKSPEVQQGFFGSVAGVFSSESAPQARSTTANSRLTVILCFQDTVRICFSIWSWNGYSYGEEKPESSSYASFSYASLRLRNRARRILEHLFAAEGLECLETLAVLWCQSTQIETRAEAVLGLLNVLNGSKPKHTIPSIFNAVYSRTSPGALEAARTSSLSSDLADTDLVAFLVEYTRSLEDDAMDEIWPDCMTFLKDILANPMPHRQTLPTLLEFMAMLAQKVDNTNFGEQKRMRKELGDVFMRLLAATFTTRSLGYLQDPSQVNLNEKSGVPDSITTARTSRASDAVTILASIVSDFPLILVENDRITNAATTISTNVIAPAIKAKSFPSNVSETFLDLFYGLSRVTQGSKQVKKDMADAFNDSRFFSFKAAFIKDHWLRMLRQYSLADKDRMPELLSRLSPPATAGIVFGVGAASARTQADRTTQLNLRRIALLILSGVEDAFVPSLTTLQEKLIELLTATPTSSPSSTTRAEIFMVLRALILRTSSLPLAPLWPLINAELTTAMSAVIPDDEHHDKYNNHSILMACKFLDTLVALDPEEFQLHEWLYISDTIDAIYRPADAQTTALSDAVAESLADTSNYAPLSDSRERADEVKAQGSAPMLESILTNVREDLQAQEDDEADVDVIALGREEFAVRVLMPFFGQLSLWAFEERYAMGIPNKEVWVEGLIADLCGGGVVGGD